MQTLTCLTVVGARPQFVKAALVSRAILARAHGDPSVRIDEQIIHTGQHYDPLLSQVFFDELGIPPPVRNLEIGSGAHGAMTGRMLAQLEAEMLARDPDWVLVYGDTNSTLAAALAAAKVHKRVAHVEAGLRSFNKRMPEEINRLLTDHVSTLLFCPTHAAVANLAREGITAGVSHVGDVMYDAALLFGRLALQRSTILERLRLEPRGFYLATVHRAENTDQPGALRGILEGLRRLSAEYPVVLPLHPRTAGAVARAGLEDLCARLRVTDPLPFLDMVRLEQAARVICTDSGGVQKEAYFHGVPCVTFREETEWVETLHCGWNRLVGADPDLLVEAVRTASAGTPIPEYGDGNAAERIVAALLEGG